MYIFVYQSSSSRYFQPLLSRVRFVSVIPFCSEGVELVVYKYYLCTEQRVHCQHLYIHLYFQVKSTYRTLSGGTLSENILLSWQWKASSSLLSMYWSSTGSLCPTGELLAIHTHTHHTSVPTQHLSHNTKVLTFPYKRKWDNSYVPLNRYKCCTRGFSTEDFLASFRLWDDNQTSARDEDDDVAAERQRIYNGGSKSDILQIKDLSKVKRKALAQRCLLDLLLQYHHFNGNSSISTNYRSVAGRGCIWAFLLFIWNKFFFNIVWNILQFSKYVQG